MVSKNTYETFTLWEYVSSFWAATVNAPDHRELDLDQTDNCSKSYWFTSVHWAVCGKLTVKLIVLQLGWNLCIKKLSWQLFSLNKALILTRMGTAEGSKWLISQEMCFQGHFGLSPVYVGIVSSWPKLKHIRFNDYLLVFE